MDALLGCANLQEIVTLGQSGLSLATRSRLLVFPASGLFTRLVAPDSPDSNTEIGLLRLP